MVVELTTESNASVIQLMTETEKVKGNHNMVWLVSEPGLYKIMLRSRTPKAEAFTRFVTHEVLPQIRKNGYYKPPKPPKEPKRRGRPVLPGPIMLERARKYELANGQKCTFEDLQFYCNLLDAPRDYFKGKQASSMISFINREMERRKITDTKYIYPTKNDIFDDVEDETYSIIVDGKVFELVK